MKKLAWGIVALALASPWAPGLGRVAAQPAPSSVTSPPGAPSPAAPGAEGPLAGGAFEIPFEKYSLQNGMEVILHRDPSLPKVAVNVWYHVGPANEPEGRSGFAHLFEHLMFEGSRHVGRDFDQLLESAGATNMNGTTSFDRTNYFETVPSQYLELALWLESDRMGFLTLDAERLEVQRGVVLNERRQSYENRPYGPSELATYDTLFPEGHPYHGNVIGSVEDLARAQLEDARSFYAAYYAPSNATLALAGDFEADRAKALIEKYFGTLPKRPAPARRKLVTPPLDAPRRLVVEEDVKLSQVSMAWRVPPSFSPEEPALEIAIEVLASGKASRLYRALVHTGLCSRVSAWLDDAELASVAGIDALVASGTPADQVESAVSKELEKLAGSPPTRAEVARAKKGLFVGLASSLQLLNGGSGESGRAGILQKLNHYLGDPGALPEQMRRVAAVEPEDVQRAAARHLALGHRLTVVTRPRTPTEEPQP